MRILGLDFGSKTVGVAVSDPLGITAQPVEIVRRKSESKLRQTLARIEELARSTGRELRAGTSENMNNTMGERPRSLSHLKKCWKRERVSCCDVG